LVAAVVAVVCDRCCECRERAF